MSDVDLKACLEQVLQALLDLRNEQCSIRSDISKLRCEIRDLWEEVNKDITHRNMKEKAITVLGNDKESQA
ncbi:unnamed protein product, partial [Mesorhabditis belari]|uniref:Uncharacterized protein n=1 Tax=Mesorhabditis belari TaxID=2138241 RepID=A0AAF3ED15_9BILA